MAIAYDQACEMLETMMVAAPINIESGRSSLIDGIVQAIDRGVRNVDALIAAALLRVHEAQERQIW
jgi:hypothetical protein